MILPSRLVMVVLPLILLMLLSTTPRAYAEVSGVHYVVSYNIVDNSGFLMVIVNTTDSGCTTHHIPVDIFSEQATVEFINYTATSTIVLGVDYNAEYGFAELLTCNPGTVELLFSASNVLEEQGLGAYSLVVDTSIASELGFVFFELVVGIPVQYEVSVAGKVAVDAINEEQGVLKLKGAGLAIITLIIPIEETTSITTPMTTPVPTLLGIPSIPLTYVVLGVVLAIIVVILVLVAHRK